MIFQKYTKDYIIKKLNFKVGDIGKLYTRKVKIINTLNAILWVISKSVAKNAKEGRFIVLPMHNKPGEQQNETSRLAVPSCHGRR